MAFSVSMSSIASTVATVAPTVAVQSPVTQNSAPRAADGGSSLSAQAQLPLSSQGAAVVVLSTDSATRGASSGEGRQVDASFDNQETRDDIDRNLEDQPLSDTNGSLIAVTA